MASVRLFMELAVNMPLQQPHPGQARFSTSASSWSLTVGSAPLIMAAMRSRFSPLYCPASMGPPETNTAGMLSLMAAMSMPGVILSQLEMHIIASALWAFTMYSTESAMMSRLGRL